MEPNDKLPDSSDEVAGADKKCPKCNGFGVTGEKNEICDDCDGWGYIDWVRRIILRNR